MTGGNPVTTCTYTGEPIVLPISMFFKVETLEEGVDYTVEYIDNVNVGTAKAIFHGIGNYSGTVERTFVIDPRSIVRFCSLSIKNIANFNDPDWQPNVVLSDRDSKLVQGKDYILTYDKSDDAVSIVIYGLRNYTGTIDKSLQIQTLEVKLKDIDRLDKVYDATSNVKLSLKISDLEFSPAVGEEDMVVLRRVTGAYDSRDVGEHTATLALTLEQAFYKNYLYVFKNVDDNGNYIITLPGAITPKQLTIRVGRASDEDGTLVPQSKVYGTADPTYFNARVSGLLQGDKLEEGGKLEREPGEDVGKYRILIGTIKATDNYTIELEEGYFEITPIDIADTAKVGLKTIGNLAYTGSAIEPEITLIYPKNVGSGFENEMLVKGVDFDVTYADNIEPGMATVTITGKGNYEGTRTTTFRIIKPASSTDNSSGSSAASAPAAPAASTPAADPAPTVQPIPAVKKTGKTTVTAAPGTMYALDLGGATGKAFKSSKKKVAVVDQSGNVAIMGAGKTRITFKVGKKKRTVTLTVKDPTVPTVIALNMSGTNAAKVGEPQTLSVTLPENTYSGVKWTSSNKKVATVKNGIVTFKKPGKVTITATATRGKKKAKVKFKVSK